MTPETQISFYRGAALDARRFATLALFDAFHHPDEPYYPKTAIDLFDHAAGVWSRIAVRDWFGASVARYASDGGPARAAALSQGGDVLIADAAGTGAVTDERVIDGRTPPMERLTQTVGGLHAIGGAGFFFRKGADGAWSVLSESFFHGDLLNLSLDEQLALIGGLDSVSDLDTLSVQDELSLISNHAQATAPFHAIGGFAPDDLYLAGRNGLMLHFDGTDIHRIESGTQSTLTNVIARDGAIYAAGAHRGAVILKGTRDTGFAPIFQAPVKQFWLDSMAFDGDDILIGDPDPATGGLYRLEAGGRLQKLPEIGAPVWKVDVIDGVVWALEAKAVNRLENGTWERFAHPDG